MTQNYNRNIDITVEYRDDDDSIIRTERYFNVSEPKVLILIDEIFERESSLSFDMARYKGRSTVYSIIFKFLSHIPEEQITDVVLVLPEFWRFFSILKKNLIKIFPEFSITTKVDSKKNSVFFIFRKHFLPIIFFSFYKNSNTAKYKIKST